MIVIVNSHGGFLTQQRASCLHTNITTGNSGIQMQQQVFKYKCNNSDQKVFNANVYSYIAAGV